MIAQDYPVTEGFGCQPGYPLNQNVCPAGQGYHNGIDYGCPAGTPVVVNGVTIGLSGATGYVTGPHLHVGRWVNGKATNPGTGGFKFNSAVVTEVSQDSTNGKFVRVQGDGASWVYLHLSQQLVKVGQTLKGGNITMDSVPNKELRTILHWGWIGKAPGPAFLAATEGLTIRQIIDKYLDGKVNKDRKRIDNFVAGV